MAKDAVRLACLSCGQANRVPLAMLESGPKCAKCAMLLAGGDVTSIDAQTHDKATRFDGLPLIVDYRAPWCGPCQTMAPEFAKAAKLLHFKARFVKFTLNNTPPFRSDCRLGVLPC